MRPVFVGTSHPHKGPEANGPRRPGSPVRPFAGLRALVAVIAIAGLAAVCGCIGSDRYAANAAPVDAAARGTGSAAGPQGGSAEAGFGSTGAAPSDTPPPWAHDVMPAPIGDDPFFDYPADVSDLHRGELVKERAVPALFGLPQAVQHQFMFRSTDSHGDPIPATATVVVPDTPWNGPGPRPIVVNAVAIDALGAACTPSYMGVHEPVAIDIPPFTTTMLNRGYAILVPDHEGPHMAYAAGILAGHIVLDSIRAMRNLPDVPTVTDPDSPLVVTGYSGGAIAAGWTAQLQPTYAPEVPLTGVTAGGVPADLALLPETMNGTLGSGLFLAASMGLAREYPQLLNHLNDFGQTVSRSPVKDLCIHALEASGLAMQPIESFTHPGVLDAPDVQAVMAENRLGSMRPTDAPLMLFSGSSEVFLGDEWIPEAGVLALRDEWCDLGANVQYLPVAGEHLSASFAAFDAVNRWIFDRIDGVPQQNGCAAR